jgi:pectate lyase
MLSLQDLQHRAAVLAFGVGLSLAVATGGAAAGFLGVPLPAFPGAEGFGAFATGGRGGTVYHVTTLADAGPGSFRDAVSQPRRIVVFDVGGVIKLTANVEVSSDLTIAGQTAPGEGICLYGRSVSLGGQSNIILRYVRFREGIAGDRGKKSLGMDHASNIIIDHCSVEWGRWDDLGITVQSHDITVQYCLMAEGIHPQSFGALIDSVTNVTLSHNLWMSNESRNPKVKGTVQYINNVVYNWGETGLCGGHSAADHALDVIGNYFIKGPSSNDRFAGQFYATDHVYQTGNLADLDTDGTLDGQPVAAADFHRADEKTYALPTFLPAPAMHPRIPVTVDPAPVAYAKIVAGAGCSLRRDVVDRRLIGELTSLGKRGKTLPHTDDKGEALAGGLVEVVGGSVPLDSDGDGIPDAWETAHGLNPRDAADAAGLDSSGYTHLEIYLNSLATSPSVGR